MGCCGKGLPMALTIEQKKQMAKMHQQSQGQRDKLSAEQETQIALIRKQRALRREGKETMADLVFTLNANGIGDTLTALIALTGLQAKYPEKPITLYLRSDNHKWINLFQHRLNLLPQGQQGQARARDINAGYDMECRTKAMIPRWARYCINCDNATPTLPVLREKEQWQAAQAQYKDAVALCPFSVYNNRNYSLEGWLTIERKLLDKGHKVVILHDHEEPLKRFQGIHILRQTPEVVAGVLLNAGVVIGVDSGLCHLSSIIQETKTIVLTGPSDTRKVFFAPVVEAKSSMHCHGCFWQAPYRADCDKACAALWAIDPEAVLGQIEALITGKQSTTLAGSLPVVAI